MGRNLPLLQDSLVWGKHLGCSTCVLMRHRERMLHAPQSNLSRKSSELPKRKSLFSTHFIFWNGVRTPLFYLIGVNHSSSAHDHPHAKHLIPSSSPFDIFEMHPLLIHERCLHYFIFSVIFSSLRYYLMQFLLFWCNKVLHLSASSCLLLVQYWWYLHHHSQSESQKMHFQFQHVCLLLALQERMQYWFLLSSWKKSAIETKQARECLMWNDLPSLISRCFLSFLIHTWVCKHLCYLRMSFLPFPCMQDPNSQLIPPMQTMMPLFILIFRNLTRHFSDAYSDQPPDYPDQGYSSSAFLCVCSCVGKLA